MTHSTDPASAGRWAACVQEILRSWYDMTGAAAPGLTAHGVADTLLGSAVSEVEAATAADLREELRRAQRTIANLREQHTRRTFGNREQTGRDRTWRDLYEAARIREVSNFNRARRAEVAVNGWAARAFASERQLRNQGDQ